MEEFIRIITFIICGISVVSSLTGKGYYCRDPDTGFLHPVNSTWQSSNFCGNYTCKLRKKNPGEATAPIRTINVTNVNITTFKAKSASNDTKSDKKVKEATDSQQTLSLNGHELAVLKSLFPADETDLKVLHEKLKHHQLGSENGDRYLTEDEIKTISNLLHNVKKSDLEAIVDIYSLAQDVYKEMDKMTNENIVQETMRFANVINNKADKHASYWYDPHYNREEIKTDMEHQGSNVVTTTDRPKTTENPNSYFTGPLANSDFGKVPYFYPITNFQRQSSYIHPNYNTQPTQATTTVKPLCNGQINKNILSAAQPYYSPVSYNYAQNYGSMMKKPFTVEAQKAVPASNYLPYPFSYIQHYNLSGYPYNTYYDGNLSPRINVNSNNNLKSFYKAMSQIPNNTKQNEKIYNKDKKDIKDPISNNNANARKSENKNLLDSLIENAKTITQKKPEWKTDPIPADVLEEVRAHFEEKLKLLMPFSLRKKVKLEKVGKVVKLDDLHRAKRSIVAAEKEDDDIEEEEMEAYCEKTTCLTDTQPGYFRMGNMTQPYPDCCPQRITD